MQEIILFATGIVAVQSLPVFMSHGDNREAIQIEEAFMISMFMLLSTLAMVSAISLAVLIYSTILQREWYKILFNLVNSGVAIAIATISAQAIGGLNGAVVGAILYTVLTAVGLAILFKFLHSNFNLDLPFRSVMLGTAILLGIAMFSSPALMPLVAIATVGTQMWYQQTRSPKPILAVIPILEL